MDLFSIFVFVLLFVSGLTAGYYQLLRISQLTWRRLKATAIIASTCLVLFALLYWLNILPKLYARYTTVGLYLLAGGFFLGSTCKVVIRQQKSGNLEYMNSSPLPLIFPKIISATIILFGIYRTQLLATSPSTTIGLSSGFSLVAFGGYGWVIQIVPALRNKGIIILDTCIPWKEVLSFCWQQKNLLQIEYYDDQNNITELQTIIPEKDQSQVTTIVENHILERNLE